MRAAFLALLLALPLAAFEAPAGPPDGPAPLAASHSVQIAYASTEGDLRPVTIRVTRQRDARPTWRGAIKQMAVYGPDGWILIESVRPIEGGVEARAQIPGPGGVYAFALLTESGESRVWSNPARPDPPKPEVESSNCPGLRCMEIYDPWSCTCPDDPNPWEDDEEGGQDEEETETSEETGGNDKDEFMSFGI